MRRLKFLGLALMVVFAFAAVISASASALILPLVEPRQNTWTGDTEGEPQLIGSAPITCTAATSEGTEELDAKEHSLGEFHITFKGCKETKNKIACNSKGDAKEVILSLGKWHLVYDKLSAKEGDTEANLGVAILFLTEPVIIECTALVKVEVKGEVLCLVLEYKTSNVKHNFHCIAEGPKATEKEWFNAGDKEKSPATAKLECAINGGKPAECAELALGLVVYPKAIKIDG